MKNLYIVHCIDTEGPLTETLEANFERLKNIYGIDLKPSQENLNLLRQKKIDLKGQEEAVKNLLDLKRTSFNESWEEISYMLDKIHSEDFLSNYKDSMDQSWKYNWFCLDHVGFTGKNPRNRDSGDHKVFDFYNKYTKKVSSGVVQWHYHPLPINGNYNSSGTTYLNSSNIWEILAKKIIERNWFPAAYRPGFHLERPDVNWFLEQWIPFDYANQAVSGNETDQPDLSNGRYGDWRSSPKDWSIYHPSHDNYQVPGNSKRWIARCLNMEARLREITQGDVDQAFSRANKEKSTLMSFTNHDFRDMSGEIDKVFQMIKSSSIKYPEVNYKFTDCITAFREVLELKKTSPGLKVSLEGKEHTSLLKVTSEGTLFGVQPFLAIKTKEGKFYWENFDFYDENVWTFTFDSEHASLDLVDQIGIAGNSPYGKTEIIKIIPNKDEIISYELN